MELSYDHSSVIIGCIVHSVAFGEIDIIDHGAIIYSKDDGIIQRVINLQTHPELSVLFSGFPKDRVQDYTGKLIIPGFVDAHCHAPQYVFTGTGMDLPLLLWLEKYTFPCEARFSDTSFARKAYEKSIKRHLKCGTTFASYFATIHTDACKVLVDVIHSVGQRALVGKVSMDRNSPDFYVEETKDGCVLAEEFAEYVLSLTEVGRDFVTKINQKPITVGTVEQMIKPSDSSQSLGLTDCESVYTASSPFVAPMNAPIQTRRPRGMTEMSEYTLSYSQHGGDSWLDSSSHSVGTPRALQLQLPIDVMKNGFVSTKVNTLTLMNSTVTPLVMPCITPRFVPTCTGEMMQKLGDIARKYALPVQSHMSESVNEIEWVAELHPDCPTYAQVYEKYGLLHENVHMAHCCNCPPEELAVLKRTGASVVHCASSNFMLSSGVMDVREFLEEGIKVALGTDVAGGYSPSMLDAIRQSIVASRVKGFDHKVYKPPQPLMEQHHLERSLSYAECNQFYTEEDFPNGHPDDGSKPVSVAQVNLQHPATAAIVSCTDCSTDGITPSPSSIRLTDSTDSLSVDDTTSSPPSPTPYRSLNYCEAFHLATVGGAEVLGMGDVIGNFKRGKKLDCLIIDVDAQDGPIDLFGEETNLQKFEKFLFLGDDRNIQNVIVDGRLVI